MSYYDEEKVYPCAAWRIFCVVAAYREFRRKGPLRYCPATPNDGRWGR